MRAVLEVGPTLVPEIRGEQPDIDTEFVEHLKAALSRGCGDQMLLDRVQLRIDDATPVESPDRQRDRKRPDQKSHADDGSAGGNGETHAAVVQPPSRPFGPAGQ